jgi:gamma-glutamyltranspeptidase/glutathione hydrolase
VAIAFAVSPALNAQAQSDPPNPYRATYGWEKMPEGQKLGVSSGVFPDRDGKHIWILARCGGNNCAGTTADPILKFDLAGNLVQSFGKGLLAFPHGFYIDREGNMMCLTPSGGVFRKSAFAPELGCTLSTRSEMFVLEEGHPNALVPGKRPRTTLVSYLICEEGVPTMTVGCPGGDDQAQADLQLVLNVLVFGMNPQQAVEAPRFSTQTLINSFYPRAYRPGQLNVEPGIPESTRSALRSLGHTVLETGACGVGAVVTRRDPHTGALSAGADPRRPTYALAW